MMLHIFSLGAVLALASSSPGPCAAHALTTMVSPAWPYGYAARRPLEADVRLTIAANGETVAERLARSTGIDAFDAAAVRAAKASAFPPDLQNCVPIRNDLLYKVTFFEDAFGANRVLSSYSWLPAAPDAAPSPQPSVAPAPCNRDAAVDVQATPQYPDSARLAHVQGAHTTLLMIDVSSAGKVAGAHIVQSSGVPALDRAALAAAEQSTYFPKMVKCKAVKGRYMFRVTFSSNR